MNINPVYNPQKMGRTKQISLNTEKSRRRAARTVCRVTKHRMR